MAILCARVLAVLTTLCFARCTFGKGILFSAKSYSIFLNDDISPGKIIGTVTAKVSGGLSPPSYVLEHSMTGVHKYIKVYRDSGKIELLKSLRLITLGRDGARRLVATIKAHSSTLSATTKVFVFALRQNFGDTMVSEAIANISKINLENHIIKKTKGGRVLVTPAVLFRLFRRIPKEAINVSLSETKQELAIDNIRKKIVKRFAIDGPGHLHFDGLNVEKLFSLKAMERLFDRVTCLKALEKPTFCDHHINYRTFDGTCNNVHYPYWGAARTKLERLLEPEYVDPDFLNLPKGSPDQFKDYGLPSTSQVSRDFIISQASPKSAQVPTSHALMQWGQFLDHDLGLSPEAEGADACEHLPCDGSLKYSVPPCFPIIPIDKSSKCIKLTRSAAVCQTDPADIQPREQMNVLTAYIDGSQIYGSSESRAKSLRYGKDGLLKMSNQNLLIFDHSDQIHPNDLCKDMGGCFLSGDTRVNEQMSLASMHTLFNREHNRIARGLKKINDHWGDEKLFKEARKIMGGVLQKITYEDYLPKIIGKDGLLPYQGYQFDVNAGIFNEFSTAAYRYGHSQIRPFFDLLDSGYNPIAKPVPLIKMFFNNRFIQKHGIEPILLGLLANVSQTVDPFLAEGITKHLFERKHSPGLDLSALNIQRGRDHGLAGYNKYRELCGLKIADTFEDTSKEIKRAEYRKTLEKLYKTPHHVDLWVAGLAEDPLPDASVGPTFKCIISKQFRNIRDGDRYYYEAEGEFTREQLREIKKVTLSHIMCDNLKGIVSIQKDAFLAPTCKESRLSCERIKEHSMDFNAWKDHAPCFSNPCLHGGYCLPINGGENYQCVCPPFWTGTNCQFRQHPCSPSPCLHPHEMVCRSEMKGSLFYCTCVPGMHHCKNHDFCKLGPCPIGHTCHNDFEIGYKCTKITT